MGPIVVALALGVLGQATKADVATGANLRWGGGAMTVSPSGGSVPATELSVTLLAGLRLSNANTTFIVRYRPTYYYQIPNAGNSYWPLFMHNVNADLSSAFSRRTTLKWSLAGSVGDANYSSLLRLLPEGTAAIGARLIPFASANSTVGIDYRQSAKLTLGINATGNYRTTIGAPQEGPPAIPTTANITVGVSARRSIATTDDITINSAFSNQSTNSPVVIGDHIQPRNNGVVAVFGSWTHRFSRSASVSSTIGASASGFYEGEVFRIMPIASLAYVDRIRSMGSSWGTNISGGTRGFFDPILGTFRPQAFLMGGINGQHPGHFQSSTNLSLGTSIAPNAIQPAQYETFGTLSSVVSYAFDPAKLVYVGANGQLRAGHPSQLSALPPQVQATVSIGLRFSLGTGASRGSWL